MLGPTGNKDSNIPLENTICKLGLVLSSLSSGHLNANLKELFYKAPDPRKSEKAELGTLTHFRDLPLPKSINLTGSTTFKKDP